MTYLLVIQRVGDFPAGKWVTMTLWRRVGGPVVSSTNLRECSPVCLGEPKGYFLE